MVLRQFKKMLEDLYAGYFKPLVEMLDNLRDTFKENQIHLKLKDEDSGSSSYTWQIMTLDDIRYRLDESIENLTAKQLVNEFVGSLLQNSDSWLGGDQDKISMLIRRQMLEIFRKETERSLQNYLFDKYPGTEGDVVRLAESVKDDILARVHGTAVPMFWCDPSFEIFNPDYSFPNSSLSVPSSASAVCSAADNFKVAHKEYAIRKTGIGDRIFAMRLFSGIPLYAYQGITLLKKNYDAAEGTAAGVGNHLYACTGRGEDGSGKKDWLHFLPTPMPYSKIESDNPGMIPQGQELLNLYDVGEKCGAIGMSPTQDLVIFQSPAYEARTYSLADFTVDGKFNMPAYEEELARLEALMSHMHDAENCKLISLKNDGSKHLGDKVIQRVRTDYFIHYPLLQKIVREEIQKYEAIQASLDSLKGVLSNHSEYEKELAQFCNMLIFDHVHCINSMGKPDREKIAIIYCEYVDKYQDTKKYELSNGTKAMVYGKTYPLYQAFINYRELEPKKSPRAELDKAVDEAERKTLKEEDLIIPYELDKLWTAEAMDALLDELSHMAPAESKEIHRFYEGLRRQILEFKDHAPMWLSESRYEELTGEGETFVDPNAYWNVWDPTSGKTLVVYAQYGAAQAYDQSTGVWVSVRPDMKVWDGTAWVELKNEPFFAGI